ncbi:AAA family ATPase [Candidatus Nanohalococcus occultus]|uniref:AAA ATPase of MoxR-like family, a component of a putative secretion system n=1 Tax=Candidatus Nanohalococcus occultus TaxID=2978047 RepID=A0ABY8CH72_9ARCH|nr:AAA ATPase of MoxR-like family, a component of a putative secretion system [Candidatus Nanohaloarchaeota archaeon SVXNc]
MKIKGMDEAGKYEKANEKLNEVLEETSKVIVGQEKVQRQLLISILCDGNVLMESYPGLGKTKMVRTLSKVLGLDFSRIQNTPDLMPSDITGTHIINENSSGEKDFVFQQGPIFSNMVLADEINRATPKTQAALLEAMEEKQVTVGNQSYSLDKPFFLMATQNPIDQEGTYPLPEAQSDRFLMKIRVDYPSQQEEEKVVDRFTGELNFDPQLNTVLSEASLLKLQEFTRQVPIADDLRTKAVNVVSETREHEDLNFGASPRASLSLVLAAKARAIIEGRNHVSEEDIEEVAQPVMRHRIGLSFQAEKQGKDADSVVEEILEKY